MLAGGITIKTNYANGKLVDDKLLEGLDKRGWADKIDKLMQQIKPGTIRSGL